MKKKHYIRVFFICMLMLFFISNKVLKYIKIQNINNNSDNYIIKSAIISDVKYDYNHIYYIVVNCELNNQLLNFMDSYDLNDYKGKKIVVAINNKTYEMTRMEVTFNYIDFVVYFLCVCLLILEFVIYNKKKKIYIERKIRESLSKE